MDDQAKQEKRDGLTTGAKSSETHIPTNNPTTAETATGPNKTKSDNPDDDLVDNEGKNGLIAAIGIILGFTVTFFGQWSLDEGLPQTSSQTRVGFLAWLDDPTLPGWTRGDIIACIIMIVGIIILIYALRCALLPYKYNAKHYRLTVNKLVWGIIFVLLGIGTAIL